MPLRKGIVGEWIHAHERDQGRVRIFVPGDSLLPPSRGRRRLTLRVDGTFEDTQAGSDDRHECLTGKYQFDGQQLTLAYSKATMKPATFKTSVNDDGTKLEIVRVEN